MSGRGLWQDVGRDASCWQTSQGRLDGRTHGQIGRGLVSLTAQLDEKPQCDLLFLPCVTSATLQGRRKARFEMFTSSSRLSLLLSDSFCRLTAKLRLGNARLSQLGATAPPPCFVLLLPWWSCRADFFGKLIFDNSPDFPCGSDKAQMVG